MRAPSFWYAENSVRSLLLAPLGWVYGSIAARRMLEPGHRPPLPVICVGNFVAGGAGKTPAALALAVLARERGLAPCFLTRGYGGRLDGPLLVDPDRHGASAVGDEALLLARAAPTVVSRNRTAAFPLLGALGADLCIMDDGFQNPSVEKALSLVVVDSAVGVGTGRVMPAGPLRAPLRVQLPAASAILIMGDGARAKAIVRMAARAAKPVLRARLEQRGAEAFRGRRVYAYAGIGRPEKFFGELEAHGVEVAGRRAFPDHHLYSGLEAREIMTAADALDALPVTTEKDAVRLARASGPQAELASRSVAFGVECVFDSPGYVAGMVAEACETWRRSG